MYKWRHWNFRDFWPPTLPLSSFLHKRSRNFTKPYASHKGVPSKPTQALFLDPVFRAIFLSILVFGLVRCVLSLRKNHKKYWTLNFGLCWLCIAIAMEIQTSTYRRRVEAWTKHKMQIEFLLSAILSNACICLIISYAYIEICSVTMYKSFL